MVSIALGIFILAIGYVIFWSIKNDKAGSIEEQTGFINIRDPVLRNRKAAGKPGRRAMTSAQAGLPQESKDRRSVPIQNTHRRQGPPR